MKHLFTTICAVLISASISFGQSNQTEVLTVEVYGTYEWQNGKYHGIFLNWPDKEPEKIDFGPCNNGEHCLTKYSPIVQKKLQVIINDGWTLLNSAGGDQFTRYIFVKEKK